MTEAKRRRARAASPPRDEIVLPACERCGAYHLDDCPEGVAPSAAMPRAPVAEPHRTVFVPLPVDPELVAMARKHHATVVDLFALGGRFLAGLIGTVDAIDRDLTRAKAALAGSARSRRRRKRAR